MKKFLLSLVAMAAFTAANAETVLDVNDATDIEGTTVEEAKKDDGSVQAAKHIQPCTSLKIGSYTFTMSQGTHKTSAPAYYWATSTNQNQDKTLRVYNGNTLTMTAPEGESLKKVLFTCAKVATGSFTASTGAAESVDGGFLWTGDANSFTLTFPGTFQIRTITIDPSTEVKPVEVNEVANIAAFLAAHDNTNNTKITGEVTFTYQNGKYAFITDATGSIEVYGQLTNTYKNGDKLTGVTGKYDEFNNMPELIPDNASFGAATAGEAVAPVEYDAATATLGQYVILKNVDITENGGKFYVGEGTELQVYDQFKLGTVAAATNVTFTGIVGVFKEQAQIFFIGLGDPASISEISIAEGRKIEIFNLRGQRLSAPQKGVNIINGVKVLVK